jgi:hypothetical protein
MGFGNTKISVAVPHQLGQDEAMQRIKAGFPQVMGQYGNQISDLKQNWTEHGADISFKARGFDLSGTLSVEPSQVEFNGTGPMAMRPFKGKAETMLKEQLQQMLA